MGLITDLATQLILKGEHLIDELRAQIGFSPESTMSLLKAHRSLKKLVSMEYNTFDIDGVIFLNDLITGVYPGPHDVLVTGRSYEEIPETRAMLKARGIENFVCYNPLPWDQKSRETSGQHKGNTIRHMQLCGFKVGCHFEDDEVQAAEIRKIVPDVPVILLQHSLTPKHNVRHRLPEVP